MTHNLGLKGFNYVILIKQQYLINFFCQMANGFKINFHELVLSRFPRRFFLICEVQNRVLWCSMIA